uniref:Uncharacterized protein n=1 Tax=Globodera rostochiensis TaxID=31243 RepID=A0A914IAN4_GLORO
MIDFVVPDKGGSHFLGFVTLVNHRTSLLLLTLRRSVPEASLHLVRRFLRMEFSKALVFILFLALCAGGVIAQGDAASAASETAVQTQEPTQELVPETEPAAPVAASQVEESTAAPEATTQTPTITNKAMTTDTENEAKKTDNGSGFGKWWNRLKCLVFGFGPFRLGCPDKKEKDGSSGGDDETASLPHKSVHGMIAIIEESGESRQLDDEQMAVSLENEVAEEEEEQQQSEENDGDNENAPAGDVQIDGQLNVSATTIETATNEEGKTQTNIAQLDAEGTLN